MSVAFVSNDIRRRQYKTENYTEAVVRWGAPNEWFVSL